METQKIEINSLIAERHSPRAFADTPVEQEKLEALFEAARWAASSYNEQPWRFVVAAKGQPGYDDLLAGLNQWNQSWAAAAPVLVFGFAKKTFSHHGKPNAHSWYDLGAAVATLSLQATELGLVLHQMAGILPDEVRQRVNVPEDFDVVVGIALGYKGDAATLSEDMREKENAPRTRKPLGEIAFSGSWGNGL